MACWPPAGAPLAHARLKSEIAILFGAGYDTQVEQCLVVLLQIDCLSLHSVLMHRYRCGRVSSQQMSMYFSNIDCRSAAQFMLFEDAQVTLVGVMIKNVCDLLHAHSQFCFAHCMQNGALAWLDAFSAVHPS